MATNNPHIFTAVHAFFAIAAVGSGNGVVRVGEQGVGQLFGGFPFGKLLGSIGANADNSCASGLDLREAVAEAARLRGAARGSGFGLKEQNDTLPTQI